MVGTALQRHAKSSLDLLSTQFPEVRAGGYSRIDGTVEFYGRVNALLKPHLRVLDFGAGRGAWREGDECAYSKSLRSLRNKVAQIVACDIN